MKPYTLLLVSLRKPDKPSGIVCSNHMIAWGLWEAFGRMSHVTLDYQDSDSPITAQGPWDHVLIHAYFGAPIYDVLPAIRQQTQGEIMLTMEVPHPSPLLDRQFTFLKSPLLNAEHTPLPCLTGLLAKHIQSKEPGSVLLDHVWLPIVGTPMDWCPRIRQWLDGYATAQLTKPEQAYAGHRCAQLCRGGCEAEEQLPFGWRGIPEMSYPSYLAATATFENFIVTHPGSYEHSIIDMAARGIRVLVPQTDGVPFVPKELVDSLHLATFADQAELSNILATPTTQPTLLDDGQPYQDLGAIANRIDAYCQEVMP